MAKSESNFWQQVKKNLKEFQWLRLESWASQGVPDLLGTTKNGQLFTVELKVIKSNKPNISPHQIAFHLQRKNSPCFILISSLVQSSSQKISALSSSFVRIRKSFGRRSFVQVSLFFVC